MTGLPTTRLILNQMASTTEGKAEQRRMLQQVEKGMANTHAVCMRQFDVYQAARETQVADLEQIRATLVEMHS